MQSADDKFEVGICNIIHNGEDAAGTIYGVDFEGASYSGKDVVTPVVDGKERIIGRVMAIRKLKPGYVQCTVGIYRQRHNSGIIKQMRSPAGAIAIPRFDENDILMEVVMSGGAPGDESTDWKII